MMKLKQQLVWLNIFFSSVFVLPLCLVLAVQSVYALDLLGVNNGGINDALSYNQLNTDNIKQTSPIISNTTAGLIPNGNKSNMFGAQLFRGAFARTSGSTFNDSYIINSGDNIQLRLWGAYQFMGTLNVDAKGNIFIPNVGPLKVAGITNGKLQGVVENSVRQVYRANVGVYASLENAQPVKVFVTGFVNQPGSYGGVSSDSVLSYLDRAGGVDAERGSYVDVQILRGGNLKQQVNLYDFLLAGALPSFAFKDGDVVMVAPRKKSFSVSGEIYNAYEFEFDSPKLTVARALKVARIKPSATHVTILHKQGSERSAEYLTIDEANVVAINDGDQLVVSADNFANSIQIRVEGAHIGEHAMVLPYGATLAEVLPKIKANELTNLSAIQLFRKSVAKRQKEMLDLSLDKLEESTLSVRSSTTEEASLRTKDADLVQRFIQKARSVEPKGQVVLTDEISNVILEQGDVIRLPEKTSVILVSGEVLMPNAFNYRKDLSVKSYILGAGGFTQKSNKSKIIVISPNGISQTVSLSYEIQQGDEILVLPEISTKGIEVTRGLSQIIYQIAIAAKVVLGL